MIELPRSTFYYRAVANTTGLADDQVVGLIQAIQDEMPSYGYGRITHELRRRGHENDPVIIEVPETVEGEESAMQFFVRAVPPEERDWLTTSATVVRYVSIVVYYHN